LRVWGFEFRVGFSVGCGGVWFRAYRSDSTMRRSTAISQFSTCVWRSAFGVVGGGFRVWGLGV